MTLPAKSISPTERKDPFRSLRRPLLVGSFVAAMVFVFLKLGSEIIEGETQGFDQTILLLAQTLRQQHPLLAELMRDLTGLGSVIVLTLITVVTVVYLALFGSKRMAALVAASMISGTALVSVFKGLFGRARPDPAFAELAASGWMRLRIRAQNKAGAADSALARQGEPTPLCA